MLSYDEDARHHFSDERDCMKIAVIGGTGVLDAEILNAPQSISVKTVYGEVELMVRDDVYFLQRHAGNVPPHRLNHKAHLKAIQCVGVTHIIGVGSCGSLKKDIKPGEIVVPHDYIAFYDVTTFFDNELHFVAPGLSENLRQIFLKVAGTMQMKVHDRGIYMQTKGPRFETAAEIHMFARFADILSMTLAHEIKLARELNLEYAAICSVDNYANGIDETPVDPGQVMRTAQSNQENVLKLVKAVIVELNQAENGSRNL